MLKNVVTVHIFVCFLSWKFEQLEESVKIESFTH